MNKVYRNSLKAWVCATALAAAAHAGAAETVKIGFIDPAL